MSKPNPEPKPPTPIAKPSPPETAAAFTGAELKKERERLGITIQHISERTRISQTILKAIEAEQFDSVPTARVYVRGFLKCLAEELKLDANRVVSGYLPRWEKWSGEHTLEAPTETAPGPAPKVGR